MLRNAVQFFVSAAQFPNIFPQNSRRPGKGGLYAHNLRISESRPTKIHAHLESVSHALALFPHAHTPKRSSKINCSKYMNIANLNPEFVFCDHMK